MNRLHHPFPACSAYGAMLLLVAAAAHSAPVTPADFATPAGQASKQQEPAQPAAIHDSGEIRITKQARNQVDPLLQNAWRTYRDGQFDQAERLYLALLKNDTHHTEALLGLAALALQRGDSPAAARYYTRVLMQDPRNARANAGIVMLQPDNDTGISRIKTLLHEQGDAAILHFALGNLYAGQARWSDARQAYASANLLEPGNAAFVFNLAVSLDHLEQSVAALRHYRSALQLDPAQRCGLDHPQIEQRIAELSEQTP